MKLYALALLLVAIGPAFAADDENIRHELAKERQRIEAEHRERVAACPTRFAVTACLEEARVSRQEALRAVDSKERAIDDARRLERSQAQAKRLADKAEAARGRNDVAGSSKPVKPGPPPLPAPVAGSRPAPQPKPAAADRSAEEQRKREAFEARKREIQAHREAVARRNVSRAKGKPLPPPEAASSP